MNELTFSEAKEIYESMEANLDRKDKDYVNLYEKMQRSAVRYAHIRAGWYQMAREKRLEEDERRTAAHDAFIASVNQVARSQGTAGALWRERLGDDRKRIGDLACYIALFLGLQSR